MANNRMVLICNVCIPKKGDWQYHQKGTLVLAKWYPAWVNDGEGAAYYRNDNGKTLGQDFLDFLEEHKHGEVASRLYIKGAGQPNPVRIEYESEDLPVLRKKKGGGKN